MTFCLLHREKRLSKKCSTVNGNICSKTTKSFPIRIEILSRREAEIKMTEKIDRAASPKVYPITKP